MRVELMNGGIEVEYGGIGIVKVRDTLHEGTDEAKEFDAAIDGITSLIAALVSIGVDITTSSFAEAVETAVMKCAEEFD